MTPQENNFEHVAAEIGALVAEKNRAYGDSFAKCGDFLRLLWPNGIAPEQYTDALAMVRIFDKQMRIATDKHALGESPYRDIAGYAILGVVKDARETARAAFTPVQECEDLDGLMPREYPFAFPPALKWMGKRGSEYVEKLLEEVNEVGETNADDPRSTMMEAFDVVHVAETMIRTIAKETGIDPAEVAGEVVAKNSKRNYYQG